MRSNEREQLKREIQSVTGSAVEGGGDGDNHVFVSVNVSGVGSEQSPAYAESVPNMKQSNRSDRNKLNPNLLVDRLFRLAGLGLMFALFAYIMNLSQ